MRLPVIERLLALPMHTKILVANSAIVAIGAVVGTLLVSLLADQLQRLVLALGVMAGIGISVAINWVIVRLALQPVVSLARTAAQIRPGEVSPRFAPLPAADSDTRRLAEALNTMLDGLAADAARLQASRRQLRALASRTLGAQEDERRRIARELHDETAQVLATLLIQASLLRSRLVVPPEAQTHLNAIEALAEAALESIRALAHDLRPSVLDDLGLAAAIRWYAANRAGPAGLVVTVEADELRLAPQTETALYRVAQEALTNILRHAHAEAATVHLRRQRDSIELTVSDDGRGFVVDDILGASNRERRLGLLGMQERVHLLGGRLTVCSQPGQGTIVAARVPLTEATLPTPHQSAREMV